MPALPRSTCRDRSLPPILAIALSVALAPPVSAEEEFFASRPAFSAAEQAAREPATCGDLEPQLPGSDPSTRVDLSTVGALTLVQTDGALWYLAVCSDPGVRVMCVTYAGNGMRIGDRVLFRGGYNRQDQTHVVLDPCLASPAAVR
jgi:hypothetical protein